MASLQTDLGLAYLFITHNFAVVDHLAHAVAVMYLGRIVEQGTVDEVLRSPQHPYTRALLSAVPSPHLDAQPEFIRLPGETPSPARPPAGCHFHPRCRQAIAACSARYPRDDQRVDDAQRALPPVRLASRAAKRRPQAAFCWLKRCVP
jgi:peptide/nickel transport system ATP-binding protein